MSLLFFFFFFLLRDLRNHLSRTRQDYGTKAIKYKSKNALWLKLCLLIVLLSTIQRFIDFKQTWSVWESFIRLRSDQIRHCGDDAGHFKWGPASLATTFFVLKKMNPAQLLATEDWCHAATSSNTFSTLSETPRTTQLDVAQIVVMLQP